MMYRSGKSHTKRGPHTQVEKLAGRLIWERTANGIRVDIPGWMGFQTLFLLVWIVGWTYAGSAAVTSILKTQGTFLTLWLLAWAAGEVLVAGSILWSLLGRIVLTQDPSNLTLVYQLGGFDFRVRSFQTTGIRNLRYRPFGRGRSGSMSAICFEQNDRTCRFATGIRDAEAFALIDKMLEVYPFTKDRALEYLDLSR